MAEKIAEKKPAQKPAQPEANGRVDTRAGEFFKYLGFDPVPPGLAQTYNDVKRVKDKLRPGPLDELGFALIVELYRLKVATGFLKE
jgi:signal transduction histidine kinase